LKRKYNRQELAGEEKHATVVYRINTLALNSAELRGQPQRSTWKKGIPAENPQYLSCYWPA